MSIYFIRAKIAATILLETGQVITEKWYTETCLAQVFENLLVGKSKKKFGPEIQYLQNDDFKEFQISQLARNHLQPLQSADDRLGNIETGAKCPSYNLWQVHQFFFWNRKNNPSDHKDHGRSFSRERAKQYANKGKVPWWILNFTK